jgi:uracil-DNA glycosylase family 4
VSRSPGKHDVKAGKPFAGPSGKVLDYLLNRHGVKRSDILTTNVVLCETDDPPLAAINACRPRLEHEIRNCELIVAGGTEATNVLTRKRSVSTARGFAHERTSCEGNQQRVVVTNNPAVVLRNSDSFPDMVRDFRRAFDPIPEPTLPEVEVIDDPNTACGVLRRWLSNPPQQLSSDLEWHLHTEEIYCAGFSRSGRKSVVFGREAVRDESVRRLLRDFYGRSRFCWHNGKSDTKVLHRNDIPATVSDDTFLLSYALDERPGVHALEYLLQDEFGWPDYEPDAVKKFKRTGEISNVGLQLLYEYNGWDAAGTQQLLNHLTPKAKADGVYDLYRDRLLRIGEAFRAVELRGFRYDVEGAANLNEREVLPRLWRLESDMQRISGLPLLNPRSPKQLQHVYYQHFGLKHDLKDMGKKKLRDSTGKEIRTEILEGRFKCKPGYKENLVQFADAHRQFSLVDKQRGTYIEGLIERAKTNGRVYCDFNPGGTVTGRSSSRRPNLQNITREGRAGIPGIRTLFLPSDGCVLIGADYSQAELRACGVFSNDSNLLGVYSDNTRSLHKERAAAFYGANYTKEEYVKSKNINFGVTYGQSAYAFAQMYHMPEGEAQAYIDSWWQAFPQLQQWTNEIKQRARTDGVIVSPFGHKRRFHLITDENFGDVMREAVNFLPQNVAAWLTMSAIIDLVELDVPIIATVHDSIVADVPKNEAEEIAVMMKIVMEAQAKEKLGWDLPFLVDVSVGENWGSMRELIV